MAKPTTQQIFIIFCTDFSIHLAYKNAQTKSDRDIKSAYNRAIGRGSAGKLTVLPHLITDATHSVVRIGRRMLTQEKLKEHLHYSPDTGLFTWKLPLSNRIKVGATAGSAHNYGYISIGLDGVVYLAHRLAWLYVHGNFPPENLDHRDGNKTNNRISNLRKATTNENNRNCCKRSHNTSGHKGVTWHKRDKKWRAICTVNKRSITLGSFDSPLEASSVYEAFAKEQFGEFYRPE